MLKCHELEAVTTLRTAMLGTTEQELLEKYVSLSCTYCCYPFDWNPVQGQLEVTKSRVKYSLASAHLGFTFMYTGFLVYRLAPGHGYIIIHT